MTDQEIVYKAIREVLNTDTPSSFASHNSIAYAIAKYACEELRKDLDSPPAEQPSEELEEEIKKYFAKCDLKQITFADIARHFAQWQKQRTIEKACEWLRRRVDVEDEVKMIDGEPEAKSFIQKNLHKIEVDNQIVEDFENAMKEELAKKENIREQIIEVPVSDIPKSKFKAGDWVITDYDNVVYIESISEGKYFLQCIDGLHEKMSVEYVDRYWRLWTIQDAKDGDVLHSTGWNNDCIFIFKGIDRWIFDETNRDRVAATGYCCLFVSSDKMELGLQGPDCIEVNTIKPATKIQRDLLFEKMEKAGYKWDNVKKELNKYEC